MSGHADWHPPGTIDLAAAVAALEIGHERTCTDAGGCTPGRGSQARGGTAGNRFSARVATDGRKHNE